MQFNNATWNGIKKKKLLSEFQRYKNCDLFQDDSLHEAVEEHYSDYRSSEQYFLWLLHIQAVFSTEWVTPAAADELCLVSDCRVCPSTSCSHSIFYSSYYSLSFQLISREYNWIINHAKDRVKMKIEKKNGNHSKEHKTKHIEIMNIFCCKLEFRLYSNCAASLKLMIYHRTPAFDFWEHYLILKCWQIIDWLWLFSISASLYWKYANALSLHGSNVIANCHWWLQFNDIIIL